MQEGRKDRLPIRLVYVVDRRTVIDQATAIAEAIKENLGEDQLCVSTLRGQLADNREWAADPSKPAIIIGTVDMIGSRLLFSGYRSSYKARPLDAGMLGQDTLLVLDEAHLSEPFAKLVQQISDRGEFQCGQGSPMRVMCMSATGGGDDPDPFKLEPSDLEGTPEENPIVRRHEAKKWITVHDAGDWKSAEKNMIEKAAELAGNNSRVVVFVRRPEQALQIRVGILRKAGFRGAVEVLTGTMRGLERDGLLGKPVFKRFLDGEERSEERAEKGPCVLVSTSAGEVGFDLNADHMVCDAAPLDSMIQRLGRVNRRGYRDATVEVFPVAERGAKNGGSDKPKHTFETAADAALKCLDRLEKSGEGGARNASPKAMAELRGKLTEDELRAACAPKPAMVELTDILLDAWSMTTIVKPMPGRPPVAKWLRGVEKEAPQTTVAWRTEVELLGHAGVELEAMGEAVERVFQKHRIRPHETLTAPTGYIVEFLRKVVGARPSLNKMPVGLLAQDFTVLTIGDLLLDDSPLRADPTLVLPPTLGGIHRGLLDDTSVASDDVADMGGYEQRAGDPARLRVLLARTDDGWVVRAMPGATLSEGLRQVGGDRADDLVNAVREKLGRNVRLQQALTADDEDNVTQYLLSLYPARPKKLPQAQLLEEHVSAVEACACRIAHDLALGEPFRSALLFAAKYHDEGKRTRTWQQAVNNGDLSRPLGKSGGKMKVGRLGGYRHEFGTLLRLTDPGGPLTELPADPASADLALHLIAAHHGSGRPHFASPDDVDFYDRRQCPQVLVQLVRRFADLQSRYGHWCLAWLENMLRCADAMASAENDGEET
jgi:CRISPR-associated endonuclease/helicase Cas3